MVRMQDYCISLKWWVGWFYTPEFPDKDQQYNGLNGLPLAIHILEQLDEDQYFDVTQIAKRFDNNEKFVRSVILFLKEINWLKESKEGKFAVTRRAKLEMSYLKIVK